MKFILTDANRSFMKIIDIDNLESLLEFMDIARDQRGLVIKENYLHSHPDEPIKFNSWGYRSLYDTLKRANITIEEFRKIKYELMIYDDWIE